MTKVPAPYKELGGYIYLPVTISGNLPESINVERNKLLLKTEFHITLVNTEFIAELINKNNVSEISAEIMEKFINLVRELPLEYYRVIKQFRFAKRDIRKSVIILAEVPKLDEFFKILSTKYHKDLPTQPAHITLYTLQPDKGIGLSSDDELNKDSRAIEIPLLKNQKF